MLPCREFVAGELLNGLSSTTPIGHRCLAPCAATGKGVRQKRVHVTFSRECKFCSPTISLAQVLGTIFIVLSAPVQLSPVERSFEIWRGNC